MHRNSLSPGRNGFAFSTLSVALLMACCSAQAQDMVAEVLRPNGASYATANDINNHGDVVGYAVVNGVNGGRFWEVNGRDWLLIGLPGSNFARATGIAPNSSGLISGVSSSGAPSLRGVLYESGSGQINHLWFKLTDLGTLGGSATDTFAISDYKTIVGRSQTSNGQWRAFRRTAAGTQVNLGTLGGTESWAFAVSGVPGSNETVAGMSTTAAGTTTARAVVWTSAGIRDLGTLGGNRASAWGVNVDSSVNYATGWADTANGTIRAVRWSGTNWSPTNLGQLPNYSGSVGYDVNAQGQVVGYAYSPTISGIDSTRAFIANQGQALTDLNTLLPAGSTVRLLRATGINSRSDIAGEANVGGVSTAVRVRRFVRQLGTTQQSQPFGGGNFYYLNNNFSSAGNPLVGAISAIPGYGGGPVELSASGNTPVRFFNNGDDGAKSAVQIGGYIYFAGDDRQGIRRINASTWSGATPGYEPLSTATQSESITTDGTRLIGNNDIQRGRVHAWDVSNTASSFSLSPAWTSVDFGGRIRGLSVIQFPGETVKRIYLSNAGAAGGPRGVFWLYSGSGYAEPIQVKDGRGNLSVPGTEAVYQVTPVISASQKDRLLLVATASKLYLWTMSGPDQVNSAAPVAVYSAGTAGPGEIQLRAPDGTPLPAGIYGVSARGGHVHLLAGDRMVRFTLALY
jgi:probable HAF family extracellular repeat protein